MKKSFDRPDQFGHRRDHAEIGKARLQIGAPQQLAVEGQLVGVVGVVIGEERYQRGLASGSRRFSSPSLKYSLPMKLTFLMPVTGPSVISNTRSTRFCSSWMTFGSTAAAKRPERR